MTAQSDVSPTNPGLFAQLTPDLEQFTPDLARGNSGRRGAAYPRGRRDTAYPRGRRGATYPRGRGAAVY